MPGLNEAASIEAAVEQALRSLSRLTDEFELIIINDGSTDRTGKLADKLAARYPQVRVVHNERNLNYGLSLLRGFSEARCEWILHNGMDLPLAPEDINKFIPFFEDSDVIVARRTSRAAHSPWRKLTSIANRLLLWMLFRPRTTDLNFVQFYRRSFVQSFHVITTSPAFVTPEIILRAERAQKRIQEVTVTFRKRTAGKHHFGRLHDMIWTLKDMLRFRLHTLWRGWEL